MGEPCDQSQKKPDKPLTQVSDPADPPNLRVKTAAPRLGRDHGAGVVISLYGALLCGVG